MQADLRERVNSFNPEFLKSQIKEELVLCKCCEGRGQIVRYETVDWHKNQQVGSYVPCYRCNSTGRVYNQTLSLHGFRPFEEREDGN